MKNESNDNANWKFEDQRAERKARKQQLNTGKKESNLGQIAITVLVVVAIVAGLFAMLFMGKGWREKRKTALLVNNKHKVTPLELNYVAGSTFQQQFQTAAFNYQGRQMLTDAFPDPVSGSFKTMRDSLLDRVTEDLAGTYALYDKAIEAGLEIGEAEEEAFERFKMTVSMSAGQQQMHPDDLLSQIFGPGATFDSLKPILQRHFLAARYQNELMEGYEFDKAELDAAYTEHPELYDYVQFHLYAINPAALALQEEKAEEEKDKPEEDEEVNEEDKDAEEAEVSEEQKDEKGAEEEKEETEEERMIRLDARAKAKAEEMEKASTSEEAYLKAAAELAPEEQKELLKDKEATLIKHGKYTELPQEIAIWAFNPERVEGDTTVMNLQNQYAVLYFVSRAKDDSHNYDSRHILIKDEQDAEDAQAAKEASKAKAEEILKKYQDGEQSEDSFAKLAEEYSEDPGSKSNGGLYENVKIGSFVKPYEDWCLEENRQPGDVNIVRVDEPYKGYHIIYFKGMGDEVWAESANTMLANQRFAEEMKKLKEETDYEIDEDGMKLVLPYDEEAMKSVESSIAEMQKQISERAEADEQNAEVEEGQVVESSEITEEASAKTEKAASEEETEAKDK